MSWLSCPSSWNYRDELTVADTVWLLKAHTSLFLCDYRPMSCSNYIMPIRELRNIRSERRGQCSEQTSTRTLLSWLRVAPMSVPGTHLLPSMSSAIVTGSRVSHQARSTLSPMVYLISYLLFREKGILIFKGGLSDVQYQTRSESCETKFFSVHPKC